MNINDWLFVYFCILLSILICSIFILFDQKKATENQISFNEWFISNLEAYAETQDN